MKNVNFEKLTFDDSLFVGVTYDLAQPIHLNGEDYETLLEVVPEAAYIVTVNYRVRMLVNRLWSLNLVNQLLSYDSFPIKTPLGALTRENWIRVTLDVLLARLTSIRDCTFLLINELFELGIDPRRVYKHTLVRHNTISHLIPLCSIINGISQVGQDFREERNYHMHRGEERSLGDDPITYSTASLFEAFGVEISGADMFGKPIDLEGKHKKIVAQLRAEFSEAIIELEEYINQLFEFVYPFFLENYRRKVRLSGNPSTAAENLIRRAEYYHARYINQEDKDN